MLEPEACKAFLEKAEAHSNDPELGKTEYCMLVIFNGRTFGKPCGMWLMNTNFEPEEAGLRKSFGRLISHCRKHSNLKLVHLTVKALGKYYQEKDSCMIMGTGLQSWKALCNTRTVSVLNVVKCRKNEIYFLNGQ